MKKRDKATYILVVAVVISLLINFMFLGKSLYQDMQKKVYDSAYNNIISTMFNKAKQGGDIELVLDGEKIKLTVNNNEEI